MLEQVWRYVRRNPFVVFPSYLAAGGILIVVQVIVACATGPSGRPLAIAPVVAGAEFVGSDTCAGCHQEINAESHGSIHAQVNVSGIEGISDTSCESCHGPGSKHVAESGGTAFERWIVNPRKSPEACLNCHVEIQSDFHMLHRHPVLEGEMNCVDCHDPHGPDIMAAGGQLAMTRQEAVCGKCHEEQTRPFVFGHEAMREGCVACHKPHGSVNRKMLSEPDANLCLKCHAQVPDGAGRVVIGAVDHSFFLRQGSCVSCHTAVHGSNIHPKLLY
ncbi:MAG: cytochrome c3 family protein [Verrucomicrobiota bacterium]